MRGILGKLKLMVPNEEAEDIHSIDYERLMKLGFRTFLFDYDNTLAPWRVIDVEERTMELFEDLLKKGMKVAVVTNAPSSRARKIKERFGERVPIFGRMGKPSIRKFKRVFMELNTLPRECVIIGDLLFTDIIVGNKLGMYTILVLPTKGSGFLKKSMRAIIQMTYFVVFYTIGWIFRLTYLLSPNEWYYRVEEIDFTKFKNCGVKLLVFDYDNTLAKWREKRLGESKLELLKKLRDMNFKIVILSNGPSSRFEYMRDEYDWIEFVHRARKPLPFKLRKILDKYEVKNSETVLIGDQLMTDIMAGNLCGIYTVKVEPIDKNEFIGTKFLRILERFFMLFIQDKPQMGRISGIH